MKMLRWICAALMAVIVVPVHANAGIRFHGGQGTPLVCLFGSVFADGCAGANQNASFTVQDQYGQTFYQLAAASGQTWTSPHPQPFNMPGIDYPVGYDKNVVFKNWLSTAAPAGCAFQVPGAGTGNPFNKVTTSNSTISGTTWTIGSLTSGFPETGQMVAGAGIPTTGANVPYVVSGAGLTWTITNPGGLSVGPEAIFSGGALLSCSSGAPVFDGWDFTTGGGGQIRVLGGSPTITNSKFINGTWTNFGSSYNISSAAGTTSSLVVKNNQFDGNHHTCTVTASYTTTTLSGTGGGTCGDSTTLHAAAVIGGGTLTNTSSTVPHLTTTCPLSAGAWSCAISLNSTTGGPSTVTIEMTDWSGPINWASTNCSILIEYNVYLNQPGADGSLGGINCPITWAYNYAYPIGLNTISKVHLATVVAGTGSTVNATVPNLSYLFNVSGLSAVGGNQGSTCFSINGTTGNNSVFTVADIEGNTCVNNKLAATGGSTNGDGLFFLNSAGLVGTFIGKSNFVDVTGALSCISSKSNTTFNMFIDDGLGGGSYDAVPGNIITISAVIPNITPYAVYVNGQVGSLSAPYGALQAYGTNIPGTGTPTTGTGKNGSYVFTGSAVAVAPTAGKAWNTPVNTIVSDPANQVATNLFDGSSIAITGVQWNLGACNGHF